jgi:hypothetical protein
MNQLLSEAAPNEAWQQVRPVLDDALHELNAADREAVVLRFLEDRSLREVGARLGLKPNPGVKTSWGCDLRPVLTGEKRVFTI